MPKVDPNGYLKGWIAENLPGLVTGLATGIVSDGSGRIGRVALGAGTDENYMNGLFSKLGEIIP